MMIKSQLTRTQRWLVRFLPASHRDNLVGDLLEEYRTRQLDQDQMRSGTSWLWKELARAVVLNLVVRTHSLIRGRRTRQPSNRRHNGKRRSNMMETFVQDLRLALRGLRRNPGFTAVAVITLTLGVGANTAIFSVLNSVLLRQFSYPEPDQLVTVWTPKSGNSRVGNPLSPADWLHLQETSESFEAWGAFQPESFNLSGNNDPVRLSGISLSPGVLEALGTFLARGRLISEQDAEDEADRVTILSDRLWRSRFGADPELIGREIRVNRELRTVIGILPRDFRFPSWQGLGEPDVLLPLYLDKADPEQGSYFLYAIGRLRSNETTESAESELKTIASRLAEIYPETNRDRTVVLVPLRDVILGDSAGRIWILLGVTGIVLLIACTNVAGLMLARNVGRSAEMAVRATLGAGKGRLLRQLLTESAVFAFIGGTAGLVVAWWGISLLRGASAAILPRADQISIDLVAVMFTYGVAFLTGILFGIFPALTSSRVDLAGTIRQGSRTVAGGLSQTRFLGTMVVAQFAFTFLLADGAALMLHSLSKATDSSELLQPEQALLAGYTQPSEESENFFTTDPLLELLLERIQDLPGVQSTGATTRLPVQGGWTAGILTDGQVYNPEIDRSFVNVVCASPGYVDAIGMTLIRGRDFSRQDGDQGNLGALVNRTFAESAWPGESPLGKRIRANAAEPWFEASVVGLVEDVRQNGLEAPVQPVVYFPFFPYFQPSRWVVVRTAGDPLTLVPTLREQLAELDPHLPLDRVFTGADLYDRMATQRRFTTRLIGLFALVALCLVVAGTYGVMSFLVRQRSHEMGVRVALGANRTKIIGLVLYSSARLASAGIILGLLSAVLASGVVGSLLYGIGPLNVSYLIGAVGFLLLVAICAALVPALRAMRIDPVEVMRAD